MKCDIKSIHILGKIYGGSTFDVPIVGVDGLYNAYNVAFPSLTSVYPQIVTDTQGLNPGTGRL